MWLFFIMPRIMVLTVRHFVWCVKEKPLGPDHLSFVQQYHLLNDLDQVAWPLFASVFKSLRVVGCSVWGERANHCRNTLGCSVVKHLASSRHSVLARMIICIVLPLLAVCPKGQCVARYFLAFHVIPYFPCKWLAIWVLNAVLKNCLLLCILCTCKMFSPWLVATK